MAALERFLHVEVLEAAILFFCAVMERVAYLTILSIRWPLAIMRQIRHEPAAVMPRLGLQILLGVIIEHYIVIGPLCSLFLWYVGAAQNAPRCALVV